MDIYMRLDTTIAADVQGPILESLGEIEKLSWVGIGFPMGSVATILLLGSLYGSFEIKWLYLGSIAVFEVGSAVCGAAPSMNAMIVGRVIAGVGGAGMYLGERALYNALVGLCWGTGAILGPLIGGAFAVSGGTWRWAFYINLVLAAVTAPIYLLWFPGCNPQPTISVKSKLAAVDWVGAVLNASTFTLFMVVLAYAGPVWEWNSAGSITLWVVFGASLVGYAVQQTFCIFTSEKNRLFPVQFLSQRIMVLLYIVTGTAASALFVPVYYVPLFFQFTKNDSAIKAAVRLLPFITVNVTFTMFSGALLPVFGYYMPWYIPSGAFMLIGGSLMYSLVTASTEAAAIYGFEVLIAIGAGLTQQIAYAVAPVKVKPHEVPAAIGFINIAQLGSISIALAISGSIYQNLGFHFLQDALKEFDYSQADIKSALAGVKSVVLTHSDARVRELAIGALVRTISSLYGLVIGAGALTLVCAAFMRLEKLPLEVSAG
ncbi:major facilitator superfamily domain-containing protein [Mariannaea sp. PMI_226]|nr:major facilitator superfamily domain-containing protein [Mariannaea sp. PMI_226]